MDWHKRWMPVCVSTESLLPTTSKSNSYIFAGGRLKSEDILDIETVKQLPNIQSSKMSCSSPKDLVSVSFPAYLNSGGYKNQPYAYGRRSSLLEGLEHTLSLISNEKLTKLALPKFEKDEVPNNKPPFDNSNLPIPLLPLHKFKHTGALYGYLDAKSYRKDTRHHSTKGSIIVITLIFLCAIGGIVSVYNYFPHMDKDELDKVKLPKNMEDAKELGRVLSKYKDTNYYEVMTAFFITYIFLQTFAIPGSVFLSILSGFLYPFYIALFLVCLCSGIGATGCYMISYFIGKPLVNKYLAERVQRWNLVVDGQREHLFNYLLFLRITPFLPNWFINIVSPVIHIPVSLFFFATFVGVAPLSFIAIQAGTTLYKLTTAGDAISWTGILVMAALAVLSILPVIFKSALKRKFE